MRDYILSILLMGLSACDAPVEQVLAQSVRWDSSPVEFTIRNNDDEVVTVRLAEVRGSEDEALRRQARNRLDALIDEASGKRMA